MADSSGGREAPDGRAVFAHFPCCAGQSSMLYKYLLKKGMMGSGAKRVSFSSLISDSECYGRRGSFKPFNLSPFCLR